MTSLIPSLAVIDGIPRASSLDIASHFNKRHTDVMRAINTAASQVPEDFAQRNFAFSEYQDATGRSLPKCDLSHDGFSFVVMGFTGKEAAQWKVVYIMAFRTMAEELSTRPVTPALPSPDAPITPDQQKTLQDIVKAKVEALPEDQRHGGLYPQAWTRFKNHFRIPRYNELPQSRMSDAVAYLMRMELRQAALPTPKRKALPSPVHPAQAKADALLAKVRFYIGEVDDIATQVQEMLAREHFQAHPDAVHDLRDTRSRMNAHVSCSTRFLWSSVNSTLSAVEDSIKLRLELCM